MRRKISLKIAVPALFVFVIAIGIAVTLGTARKAERGFGGSVIRMRDEGFFPETLTVQQGITVRFINEGDQHHWPASDIHPTHTLYPGFDPRKTIPPGSEWSFTFEQVGEWEFHDHVQPLFIGTIIVEPDR